MDGILQSMKKAARAAFRTREYAALRGRVGYSRLALSRMKKRGEIVSVKNGWWAFPDSQPEAIACEISKPCYLSFHSALHLHGLTTQIPRTIQLAVARKPKKYGINGTPAKEYRVEPRRFSGFSRRESVVLAEPEKAFADCLLIPRACPQVVLAEAIGRVDAIKVEKLLRSSKAAQARFGRLLRAGKERT